MFCLYLCLCVSAFSPLEFCSLQDGKHRQRGNFDIYQAVAYVWYVTLRGGFISLCPRVRGYGSWRDEKSSDLSVGHETRISLNISTSSKRLLTKNTTSVGENAIAGVFIRPELIQCRDWT